MKQTNLSGNGNSLLADAVSKLNPEVFSHPVWLRFGKQQRSKPLDFLLDLISAAQTLEKEDPSAACQILLICAVYQRNAGHYDHALKSTQKARMLAENTGLTRETLWALWAAGSICLGAGKYEQAASSLADLQAALIEQNEWILADFVEVVKQSIFQPAELDAAEGFRSTRDPPSTDLLAFTFDWLQEWGFSDLPARPDAGGLSSHPASHVTTYSTLIQSMFSLQRWQTLMLAIRSELSLHWGSIFSSLRPHGPVRRLDHQAPEEIPQPGSLPRLMTAKENAPRKVRPRKNKPVVAGAPANRKPQAAQVETVVPVAVHMLGGFDITIGDLMLKLPASRGLSVMKYMLLHHKQKIPREVLIDAFWPDADPETARNNLNVAIHSLRKALRTAIFLPVIVFEAGSYGLEANLRIWLDVEEFERCAREGQRLEARNQRTAAVAEYETAISLYQGDLLEQNLYEEWTILDRERLRVAYLEVVDRLSQIYFGQERYAACITVCQLLLARDRCREDAHCLLMRCYSRQRQHYLALRQYQICSEALDQDLGVEPAPETTDLFKQIRQHKLI